jgi:hypothetical protein
MLMPQKSYALRRATGRKVRVGKGIDSHRPSRRLFKRSGKGIASERPMGGKHNDADGDHAEKYGAANPEPSRYWPVRCRRGRFDEHLEVQAIRMPRTGETPFPVAGHVAAIRQNSSSTKSSMRLSPRWEGGTVPFFTHSLRLSPAGSSAIRVRRQGADYPRLVAFFVYCVRNRSAAKTICCRGHD